MAYLMATMSDNIVVRQCYKYTILVGIINKRYSGTHFLWKEATLLLDEPMSIGEVVFFEY
jgi:hypothetical protein